MKMTVHARVKNGRLLVDEPTDLPDGTELVLVPAGAARLLEAIDAGLEDEKAGRVVSHRAVIAEMKGRAATVFEGHRLMPRDDEDGDEDG